MVTGVWLGNDDNSPTKKTTGGGLPVEVWTRFMRTAHQGVPVAQLPNSRQSGFFSNIAQAGPQPEPPSSVPMATNAPAGRPAATRTSVRPEAASGLDGWLMDRLFGGR
jgi:penicillin-binding protein 1A